MKYCNADEAGDKGTGYRRQNPHAAAGTRSRLAHIIPLFRFRIMNRHSPDERPDLPGGNWTALIVREGAKTLHRTTEKSLGTQ